MKKAVLTLKEIIKILREKGYSAKIRYDKTIIVIDTYNGGSYFFSKGKKLEELIKFVLESR